MDSSPTMSLTQARRWCRKLATSHYENFSVASRFLPGEKRDEYFALYAFARGADDLADEFYAAQSSSVRLQALAEWEEMLKALYRGVEPSHPAFIALKPVIERYNLEYDLFAALLTAFRHDQVQNRYPTWEELREYSAGSADPVGRLVLRLYGLRRESLDQFSDFICSGLQLVNFLQDFREDYCQRDRIYLPGEDLERFQVEEEKLAKSPAPENVRKLIAFEAQRAEKLLAAGRPLTFLVPPGLKRQLILFHGGGRLALHNLKTAVYNFTAQSVRVTAIQKAALISRTLRGIPL